MSRVALIHVKCSAQLKSARISLQRQHKTDLSKLQLHPGIGVRAQVKASLSKWLFEFRLAAFLDH
eukprot:m.49884 g.49884  ORF g.49884 m.49884 type:complete len:65 (+) comp34038_c1_seq3:127-321(+)